jgi:hypothetical protein
MAIAPSAHGARLDPREAQVGLANIESYFADFALIGCAVTIGWLLFRGVDEKRWYEMAAASSSSIWR